MSSNSHSSNANDRTNDNEDDLGLRRSNPSSSINNSGIASDSATLNTHSQHVHTNPSTSPATTSTINASNNPANPIVPPNPSTQAPPASTAPARARWSQTVGTTIFSYDPNTRRLVPVAGTVPITTWAPLGPTAGPAGNSGGAPDAAAGAGLAEGAGPAGPVGAGGNPFGMDFGEEGHMSTHLSFSTADGRPIPIALMRHLLSGMTGLATATPAAPTAPGPPAPPVVGPSPRPGSPRDQRSYPASGQQANTSTGSQTATSSAAEQQRTPTQIFEEALYGRLRSGASTNASTSILPSGLPATATSDAVPSFLDYPDVADGVAGVAWLPYRRAAPADPVGPTDPSSLSALARERRRERRELRQRQADYETRERERLGRRASSVPPPSLSTGEAGPSTSGSGEAGGEGGEAPFDLFRQFWGAIPRPRPDRDADDASVDPLPQQQQPMGGGGGWSAPIVGPDGASMTTRFLGTEPPPGMPTGMGMGMPMPTPMHPTTDDPREAGMPPWMADAGAGGGGAAGMPQLPPGIVGMGIGATGPFGIPFAMMGMGMGGIGVPGMEMERPPDTRRAKELLKGLTLVPRGLVRRMERVERMLGEEAAIGTEGEGGRLVCAVCYDPLLAPAEAQQEKEKEEKQVHDALQAACDGEKRDASMEVDQADAEDKPDSRTSPDDSRVKTSKEEGTAPKSKKSSAKPKHPSLDPTALIALPCTHVFHAVDCLLPWFEQGKTTCPTCRFDVDPRSETLNVARWLGGARRRAAATANNVPRINTSQGNAAGTDAATRAEDGPVGGSAAPTAFDTPATASEEDTPMDVDEDEDETDAFTGDDDGALPGELDPGMIFRDAIGRAVASALSQALMNPNPTPPQQLTPQPGSAPNVNFPNAIPRGNTTIDVVMFDAGGPPSDLDPRYPSAENIELPGANRDQFGRMLRDDGESSIAATNNSTPQTINGDLELSPTMERSQSHRQRGMRAQAPSPSPHVSPPPQQSSSSTSGLRAGFVPVLNRFDRFWAPRDISAQDDAPIAGSSSSAQAPPTARPETPRHHPYAHHSRQATNARPTPTASPVPSVSTPAFAQNLPPPWNSTGENPTPGITGAAPTLPFPHEHNGGRVSITRHSITFNLALPIPNLFGPPPPPAGGAANGVNPTQQQQTDTGVNPVPDFLNNVFSRAGLFGGPPGSGTRERASLRPRKKWIAPEGTSLRSVIESKERQAGLRCDDVSCLWGPEDGDDENVDVKIHPDRTYLRKATTDSEASCVHRYHPECLLTASRVAEAGLDREIDSVSGSEWLEVGCPFCRVHGGQEKCEWRMHRTLADVV